MPARNAYGLWLGSGVLESRLIRDDLACQVHSAYSLMKIRGSEHAQDGFPCEKGKLYDRMPFIIVKLI